MDSTWKPQLKKVPRRRKSRPNREDGHFDMNPRPHPLGEPCISCGRISTGRCHAAERALVHAAKNARRGAETQRLLAHVSASQRLSGRSSPRPMSRSGPCDSNPPRNVPSSMRQKIPPRRGDAEVGGPCLCVSAAPRAILQQSISPSGRCHSNPSLNAPASMRQKRPRRLRDADVVAPWLRVSASQPENLHKAEVRQHAGSPDPA